VYTSANAVMIQIWTALIAMLDFPTKSSFPIRKRSTGFTLASRPNQRGKDFELCQYVCPETRETRSFCVGPCHLVTRASH